MFVVRDIPNYSQIFSELGAALRQMHDANVGLPASRPGQALLDNFAFALEEADPYGGKIFLTPPYQLSPAVTFEQVATDLRAELGDTELFFESEVAHLLDKTLQGWNDEQQSQ